MLDLLNSDEQKIKVAIIGYGHLGKWHLEKALKFPCVQVVGVVDHSQEKENELKQKYPEISFFYSLHEIIDKIDAAFVVTPTSFHYEIAKVLLLKGKHVFCEKPLTDSEETALELLAIHKTQQSVFQVGHSERFHLCWEELLKNRNFLDDTQIIYFRRMAPFKGRALDVDVVSDLMIHDLDLFHYLFPNAKILNFFTTKQCIKGPKVDHVCSSANVENGPSALFIAGRYASREIREVEIVSSKGTLLVDLLNCQISKALEEDSFEVKTETYERRDHLFLEHQDFYQSILSQRPVLVGINEGVEAVMNFQKILGPLESK